MLLTRISRYLRKIYIERSSSAKKIKYFKSLGMQIGEKCHIEGRLLYTNEAYLIEIGDHVAIADDSLFITHDPGLWCFCEESPEDDIFGKIKIGNNVLIGMRCVLLPNTSIGNNCIVGAGSVVRGTFPDNSVIVGNPAKVETNMKVLKFLYSQNPGRLRTSKMTDKQKEPIVKKHFGID